jgi:hypothetical protein
MQPRPVLTGIWPVLAGIGRYWPVFGRYWPALTGIWTGTGLGLFYTGLGAGTRHSGHSGRYRNGIHNYGRNWLFVIFNIFIFYYSLLDSASSQDGEGEAGRFPQHHRGPLRRCPPWGEVTQQIRSYSATATELRGTISCMRHAQCGRRLCWSSQAATTRRESELAPHELKWC